MLMRQLSQPPDLGWLLIQYFYKGLVPSDRSTIDAASGGTLVNKTPTEARELISTTAENAQQFETRAPGSTTSSREVSEIRAKLSELSSLVKQVFTARQQPSAS